MQVQPGHISLSKDISRGGEAGVCSWRNLRKENSGKLYQGLSVTESTPGKKAERPNLAKSPTAEPVKQKRSLPPSEG